MWSLILKIFALGVFTATLCLFYGFFIEPRTLKVRHVEFLEPRWTGARLKIALISDIHIGGWHVDPDRVAHIVDQINAESPDLVLIAGDFVSGHDKAIDRSNEFNAEIKAGMQKLSGISAPLGTYASLGNHDDWYDGDGISGMLTRAGVKVLDNAHEMMKNEGLDFCLIGLPDSWTGEINTAVFKGCGSERTIAFMHSPDSFKYLPASTTLALTGHTHGGQINLPFYGRRVTATDIGPDFAYGKLRYKNIPVYVTAGIGTSILPARFRAPPEIAIITISAPDQKFVFKR
ncbi:MAG: metallophosphoesterase [Acidimicrobiales bacterium]|nr:metallophosphoesterase [Hyphomonadaceae bacterium]RZV37780.1 MAG: metallophosphoesterase [Acidimicrobiales bacterium]